MGVLSPSAATRSRQDAADGPQRIVVDFAAGDHGNFRVEELDQAAQDAALRLAAQAQQDEIVARKQGVDDLRNHAVFVAMDAGKQRLVPLDRAQQIAANLIFYGQRAGARVEIRNAFQLANRARLGMSCRMR